MSSAEALQAAKKRLAEIESDAERGGVWTNPTYLTRLRRATERDIATLAVISSAPVSFPDDHWLVAPLIAEYLPERSGDSATTGAPRCADHNDTFCDLCGHAPAVPSGSPTEARYEAYQQGHLDACKGAEGECVLRPDSTYPSYGQGHADGSKVAEALSEAVRDLLWRVTPYGETEDGDVAQYVVSKGTVHRLVGAAQSAGISASLRNMGTPAPTEQRPTDRCAECGMEIKRGSNGAWHHAFVTVHDPRPVTTPEATRGE